MSQYVFGTGQLFATPVGGGAPLRFGALQDVNVDFSGDIKQLYGQYQFALDVARGKTKIEWKASTGNVDVNAFNQIFFGQTVDTGDEMLQAINEPGAIPAMTTYTVTATHGADFIMDLGVYAALDGTPFVQVPSAPAAGEYTVSAAGVYTFNASDASKNVLLNYLYDSPSTGGSLIVGNQLMGNTPKFQLVLSQVYEGKTFSLLLYSNVADKLTLPLKQDDYLIADLSGQAFADAANRVARISTTSVAGGGA
jgi:hypothetical protein